MLKIMEMHFDFKLSSILSGIGTLQSKVEQISVEKGAPLNEEDAGEREMNRKRHSVAMTECKPCSCSKDADQEAFEDEETRDGGLRRIPALTEQEILAAVAQMNFEQAARLRDAIAVLKPSSYSGQRCPDNGNPSEADVNAVSSPIEEKRRAAVLERALARASGRAPGPAVDAELGVFVPGSCLGEHDETTLNVDDDKLNNYLRVWSRGGIQTGPKA